MDVIIMQSTISLVSQLKNNYPNFSFRKADHFLWSSKEQTVYYIANDYNNSAFLLHELSHAILNHSNYNRDIELIAMESQAWDKAIELGAEYNIQIDIDVIQSALDTYRNWLHRRSNCPICTATGIQTKKDSYKCLACNKKWQVNEARLCDLRRYKITK